MLPIFQRYVFRELFSNMQSLFIPNLYVGDKEDSEEVQIEELIQDYLRWVTENLCSWVFVLSVELYVCFSEKFKKECNVCHRQYTTTCLQRQKKYTILSINRTKLNDPNLKSRCKIKIPYYAISCFLNCRERQTHLILIFPRYFIIKKISSLKFFTVNSN